MYARHMALLFREQLVVQNGFTYFVKLAKIDDGPRLDPEPGKKSFATLSGCVNRPSIAVAAEAFVGPWLPEDEEPHASACSSAVRRVAPLPHSIDCANSSTVAPKFSEKVRLG
mmetsp:Transcript_88261/g.285096  ORF Transcript_88261/g.285096 Transcript_88261/m.285096 type:complete len:113 (+) Transcript_88261:2038-2376(+)